MRVGPHDLRAQAEVPGAPRTDTPKHQPFSASADVSSAPNASTRTAFGEADRSTFAANLGQMSAAECGRIMRLVPELRR